MIADKAAIFGNKIDLHLSTSGHYCVDIIPNFTSNEPSEEILILENKLKGDAKIAQIKKIHRQFGHASIGNMQKLIGNAKLLTKDISLLIKKVANTCKICVKFREPNARPVVAFTKAKDFNQIHQLSTNFWYMHFVDEFTRYSAAVIVELLEIKLYVIKHQRNTQEQKHGLIQKMLQISKSLNQN